MEKKVFKEKKKYRLLFTYLFTVSIVGFLIFGGIYLNYLYKMRFYQSVEGIIVDTDTSKSSLFDKNIISNRVTYKYTYEDKEYISSRNELTKFNKKIGKKVKINVFKNNPNILESSYGRTMFLVLTIISCFFMTIFGIVVFKKDKKWVFRGEC